MASTEGVLDLDQRYTLIARRQTFLSPSGGDTIRAILANTKNPKLAWETTPTGKPHIGYLIPIAKLADFLRGGVSITILFLDVYGFLINYIHPMPLVVHRKAYYTHLVRAVLSALGTSPAQIRFVDESSYACTSDFITDHYKLCALMRQQDAKDASDEIANSAMLSPLLTPGHQTLSEQYLDIDIQFGGEDQRGLFRHSEIFLPQLGYKKRGHIMNPMLPSLHGGKMSSSHSVRTKIEFLDDPDTVRAKIYGASCSPCSLPPNNGILAILRDILFPISEQRVERLGGDIGMNREDQSITGGQHPFCSPNAPKGTVFSITLEGEGSQKHYTSYDEIEADFILGTLSPGVLKSAITEAINAILAPIRKAYAESEEWQAVDKLAYPEVGKLC